MSRATRPRTLPEHERKVAAVAARVRSLAERGGEAHIDKGGVHHVVPLPGTDRRFRGRPIDVSGLNRILEIDVEGRRCAAEPGVTFREVVEATLPHGLVPGVVPELEGITLGGAVAGCSVESTSFRQGGFHDTCTDYEVVAGTGEVVTCSPDHDPLAFGMIHGSYGTLGILSRISFRLFPARPFVRLEYRRYGDADAFHAAALEWCERDDADFIDGIVHGPDRFVLCLGRFVEQAPYTSDYRRLHIYYKSTARRREDFLRMPDYLFRYDTEAHWLSRTIPPMEWKPVRFAVGKVFLGSTNLIKWSKRLGPVFALRKRPDVVCDYFIPAARCGEFYEWYGREIAYYPLWVVPYRTPRPYPWVSEEHAARFQGDLFMDLAVYGARNNHPTIDYSRLLEEKTYELAGIKTLISRNHYSRERFWEIYNRESYEKAKARLDPHGLFPDLYQKLISR